GEPAAASPGLLGQAAARDGYVAWAPVAGQDEDGTLSVVRQPAVAALGLILAAALFGLTFLARRGGWRGGYLMAGPALAGAAVAGGTAARPRLVAAGRRPGHVGGGVPRRGRPPPRRAREGEIDSHAEGHRRRGGGHGAAVVRGPRRRAAAAAHEEGRRRQRLR